MGYDLFGDSGVKTVKHFQLRFGSGDALEPFYYRILYALRNNRNYQVIKKIKDYYNISPNTQQFGFASQNLRQEISSASGLLSQVGQIVKGLVGMRKDKQRIDECLDYYEDKGKPNELVLKGLWADFVDSKTGPASLTQAAQKLEFFVARDWFFRVNSLKEIEGLEVPGTLKNFLTKKYREYLTWKKHWKSRLEDMKAIIDQQIKASKQTVNLYKQWIQPLLNNVEALKMAPDPLNPDLLKIGGSTYSQVELVSWKKVDAKLGNRVIFDYEPPKSFDKSKPLGKQGVTKFHGKSVPFMPFIHIVLTLRAGPKGVTETVVDFYGKVMDKKKFEELYWNDWVKDPAEEWIENLMLKEELPLDLGEKAEEPKVDESKSFLSLISDQVDSIVGKVDAVRNNFLKSLGFGRKKQLTKYQLDKLVGAASGEMSKDTGLIYFVVKKSFGMLAEFEMYL